MDNLKALGRGTQLMFISAVLLLIVSFLRWQEVSVDLGPLGEQSAGVSAWDDIGGILMGILTIVLIARIAARLAAVDIPIPLSFATTSFVLGVLIAFLAIIKNLTDDYSTFWSYLGVVLAILVAVGAWMEVQQAGGLDSVRAEATSLSSSVGGAAATEGAATAPSTPPPPPVVEAAPAAQETMAAADDVADVPADATHDAADAADATPPSERES
jgi:hypothetical protein